MQKKILDILLNTDDFISGQEISERLGVSRQAVWKSINALKEKGYEIQSVTNRGYRLVSSPNYLNESSLKSLLHNRIIGKNLIVLDSVDSTNDYLKKLGNEGCENGTVVIAREQTKGKGRLGRTWQSKKDDGIAFSVLLRPNAAPSEVSAITPLAGLAVCKAIREYTKLDCVIKWPNDIIVGRKKLVGILTEMSAEFGDGVMVLPVAYTKGLEFDAVLLFDPSERKYPSDDGNVKLLYVAATRALHELAVLHRGKLTELIAKPAPKDKHQEEFASEPLTKAKEYEKKTFTEKEILQQQRIYGQKDEIID